MASSLSRRPMIMTVVCGALAIVSMAYCLALGIPKLQAQRQDIDDHRASIEVVQQEQSNFQNLSRDIQQIKDQQTDLNKFVWSFAEEERFFSLWSAIADAQNVSIANPDVADVTPNGQILERSATVHVVGPLPAVLDTLDAIQKIQPLVFIKQVTLNNGLNASSSDATVETEMLWQ